MRKILLLLILFFPYMLCAENSAENKAFLQYQEAEREQTPEKRRTLFNQALAEYLKITPEYPSGAFLYNVGNCYFQLGEYGLALLYYYRAEKKLPRDEKIAHNIAVSLYKAHLEPAKSSALADFVLFFHKKTSVYEKELCVLASMLFSFFFFSFSLWLAYPVFRRLAFFCFFVFLLFSASLIQTSYFSPLELVVIRPTILLDSPSNKLQETQGTPLLAGLKVHVKAVLKDGNWFQVKLENGQEGYISNENARII